MTKGSLPPNHDDALPAQDPINIEASHKVQDAIGYALQAHYVELVREPIPDRLLKLLAKLETGELHDE